MKNPVTPSGNETATFRIEAQYLNQLRYRAQEDIKIILFYLIYTVARFDVLTAVLLNSRVPWDVTPCA